MSCTSGCPTPGAHESWGACLRAKAIQVQPGIMESESRKAFDLDLSSYASARAEGLQPKSPDHAAVVEARKFSDATGVGDPWQ